MFVDNAVDTQPLPIFSSKDNLTVKPIAQSGYVSGFIKGKRIQFTSPDFIQAFLTAGEIVDHARKH